MSGICIRAISKSFGDTRVLNGVNLDIAPGEFMTLVGPSGCGKTTLLRIISGLDHQDSGSVVIDDRVIDRLRPCDRDLAMVFQSYALYPHLTVFDNIAVPLRMKHLNFAQRFPLVGGMVPGKQRIESGVRKSVVKAAETLEIGHLLDRKPSQLSGGQRQRVALGRAMVRDPIAFLMDEPLSNLDAKLRAHMRTEIVQLHRRLGATFVYVTHDQAEAMTMSDRIAVIMAGDILQVATPDVIYHDPVDVRVAQFIGSPKINLLPAMVNEGGAVAILGHDLPMTVPLLAGTALTAGVRTEDFFLSPQGEGTWYAAIVHIENLGPEFLLHALMEGVSTPIIVRAETAFARTLDIGMEISLSVSGDRVLLFDTDGRRVRPHSASADLRMTG